MMTEPLGRPAFGESSADSFADSAAIAELSSELEALKAARLEERFIWVVSAIITFDAFVFNQMQSWSGPFVIGVIQFLLLVVLARKLGIEEVSQVLAKLLERAADAMPGGTKLAPHSQQSASQARINEGQEVRENDGQEANRS